MVKKKKPFYGESSRSSQKRQRLPSIVEEAELEEEVGGTADENQNAVVSEARSGKISNLDVLDCPVCCHPLNIPIFQCDNSHVACSSCCVNLRNKCPFCGFPTGNIRVRSLEAVVEAVLVSCPNAQFGCTQEFSYGKELDHETECRFALCYCPAPHCDYAGVYKDLYSHYYANHKETWKYFEPGVSHLNWLYYGLKDYVIQELGDGPLVVVQSFRVPDGLHVTVNCIAPSAPGLGEYSYNITYSKGSHRMVFDPPGMMNRIQKVSFQTPEKGEHVMEVPDSFLSCPNHLKMHICIRRLVEEEKPAQEGETKEEK